MFPRRVSKQKLNIVMKRWTQLSVVIRWHVEDPKLQTQVPLLNSPRATTMAGQTPSQVPKEPWTICVGLPCALAVLSLSLFLYLTHSDSLNYFYGYVCIWMSWTLKYLTPRGIDPKTIEPRWQCQEQNAIIIGLIPNHFGGTCKFEPIWYARFITETEQHCKDSTQVLTSNKMAGFYATVNSLHQNQCIDLLWQQW